MTVTKRICKAGHEYLKSSDCPTCPVCEAERKPNSSFLSAVSAPARRALEQKGIDCIEKLANYSEQDILSLHGMGPASIPILKAALKAKNLSFKNEHMSQDDVAEYILQFPQEVQTRLNQLRSCIKANATEAVESIAYKMPAYKLFQKPLVYFAGYKNHIGLYATPSGHEKFKLELSKYKQGKGSVQFPLTDELPIKLIGEIVRFKVKEIGAKHKS